MGESYQSQVQMWYSWRNWYWWVKWGCYYHRSRWNYSGCWVEMAVMVNKKGLWFLGSVSEFNGSGMLDLISTWGSTANTTLTELNFDTDFFEMGLLADANKEKGEGRKMRNRSKRKCQRRELSYLRKSTKKRTVMQMDTIRFQCKKIHNMLALCRYLAWLRKDGSSH